VSSLNFPFKIQKFPLWLQIALGLVAIYLLYYISTNLSPYISVWDEEDSSFYEATTQALHINRINPSAPTAFIFWEKDCADCKDSLKGLQSAPSKLRIYGIHLSEPKSSEIEIREQWNKWAPQASQLIIDQQQFLQTSFSVRATPEVFIYLPKQKKVFSFLGDVRDRLKRMNEIIDSE
jgi:hypothetical protein